MPRKSQYEKIKSSPSALEKHRKSVYEAISRRKSVARAAKAASAKKQFLTNFPQWENTALTPLETECVRLRYFGSDIKQLTYKEIGSNLGISAQKAKETIDIAIRKLTAAKAVTSR